MITSHFKDSIRSGSLRKLGMSAASALTYLALAGHPAAATIGPTVSVVLSNSSPKTNDVLTATPTPLGFTGTPSYSYVWKNGATTIPGQNGPTLNLATPTFGDKGNVITCTVTATVASPSQSATDTKTATVVNSAPTVLNVELPTRLGSAVLGRLQTTDDDGDAVTAASVNPLITFDSQGYFIYTPSAGGDSTVPFTVTDGTDTTNASALFHVAVLNPGTKIYSALGASDVQGYGAADYNYNITGVASQGYAPLVAAPDKLGGTISPLALSRRAVNGMSLAASAHTVNGFSTDSLAAADQAQAYSIWYGPNDVLYELLPLLVQSGLTSQAGANAVVTSYMNNWNPGYAALKSSLATASPSSKFAAISVPDFGPSLAVLAGPRFGLNSTQQFYLSNALTSACAQMSTTIKATIPATVDIQNNTDLSLPADNALLFNPATDLFTDGFHPNSAGYAKLATRLYRQLDKQFNHVLSVSDASVLEGNVTNGTVPLNFTVNLSAPSATPVTVHYATSDGTGTAGSDYVAASGNLTIPAGQTSGTIPVFISGDTIYEPNETFALTLSAPTNATLGASSAATGTISNDDAVPQLSVSNVTKVEGNSGTTSFDFKVNLSTASASSVTVNYATSNGTAASGSDYTAATGLLTINPGQTTGTISVLVNGDTAVEPDETFNLALSTPSGATLSANGGSAVGTIVNDDADATPAAVNVTSQVQVFRSSLTRNRTTGRWILNLVLQNNGASLDGPLSLALDGLTPTASLYNPDGTSSRTTPVGSPYRKLTLPGVTGPKPDGVFAAGTTLNLTIEFLNPSNGATDFTPRVLQGPTGSL